MNYPDGNRRAQMNASIGQVSNYRNSLGRQHFAIKSQVNNENQPNVNSETYRHGAHALNSQVNTEPQPNVNSETYRHGAHALNSQMNSPSYDAQTVNSQQKRSLGLTNAPHRVKTTPLVRVTNEDPDLNFTSNNFNFENIIPLKSGTTENDISEWIRNLPNSSNQCKSSTFPRSPLSAVESYGDREANQLPPIKKTTNHRNLFDQLLPAPATVQCPYCGDGLMMTKEQFSEHLTDFHRHRYNTCTLPLHHHLSPSEKAAKLNLPKPKCSGCGEEKEDYSSAYKCLMRHKKEKKDRKRKRDEEESVIGGVRLEEGDEQLNTEGQGPVVESEGGQVKEKFLCPHEGCSDELPTADSLQQHRLRRHNFRVKHANAAPSVPKCEFCNKLFSRHGSIKRHLKTCIKNPANMHKNTTPEIQTPQSPVPQPQIQNQITWLQSQNQTTLPQNHNYQTQSQIYQAHNQVYSPRNINSTPQQQNYSIEMQTYQTHPSNPISMHHHHPNAAGQSKHTPATSSLSILPSSQGSYSSVLTIDSNCGLIN